MIKATNLYKTYRQKNGVPVLALNGVSLEFDETGLVFILGKSGCGKSTLLNILGGLDVADSGDIEIKGKSCSAFKQGDFDAYRNTFVGFVFQEYNIFYELTVGANIALALQLQGKKATNRHVNEILEEVGLTGYGDRKPYELSGGQKQRVAIARALIKEPQVIMADEPTGALDSATGIQVFDTLKKLAKNKLVIVVSHDREFAESYGDRVIELADGKVISDITKHVDSAQETDDEFSVIDNKLIHIKKGYELTRSDLQRIAEFVKQSKSDTFLSSGAITTDEVNALTPKSLVAGQASFTDTSTVVKPERTYNADETKFIKARLPFIHVLRLGASGVKTKPFRLVLTILLSCIAFVIFGVVDSGTAYDKRDAATRTFLEQNADIALFEYCKYTKSVTGISEYISKTNIGFSAKDVEAFEQETGEDFVAVYDDINLSLFNNLLQPLAILSNTYTDYYSTKVTGFANLSQSEAAALGFTVYGRLPSTSTEVALPKLFYDAFTIAGFQNEDMGEAVSSTDFTTEDAVSNNIFGKHICYANSLGEIVQLEIVGVVDTKASSTGFEQFLPGQGDYKTIDSDLRRKMENYFDNALHCTLFVGENFVADNVSLASGKLPNYVAASKSTIIVSFDGASYYTSFQARGVAKLADIDKVKHVTLNENLTDGKIYVPVDILAEIAASQAGTVNVNKAIMMPNADGTEEERMFYSGESYVRYGIPVEALKEYIDGLSATELAAIFSSDEYAAAAQAFEVPDNLTEDQKKISLAYIMGEKSKGSDGKSFVNDLYYTSTNAYTCSLEIIGNKQIEYAVNKTFINPLSCKGSFSRGEIYEPVYLAGYYYPTREYYSSGGYVAFSDDLYEYNESLRDPGIYARVIGVMPSTYSGVRAYVDLNYANDNMAVGEVRYGYNLRHQVISWANDPDYTIKVLFDVLLYASIIIAVFATLLLWNYISVSVTNKKKEIGILRAVGAKSSDVFLIFLVESVIIGLICAVISIIISAITITTLNSVMFNRGFFHINVLVFSIRQVGVILGLSMLVAVLGSFIPSYLISRKRPVEAINNK